MTSSILTNRDYLKNALGINRIIKKIYNKHKIKYSKNVKNILKKYGAQNIKKISVHRTLMTRLMYNLTNFITCYDLYYTMKKQGIEMLYHVWFEIEVEGFNEIIIIEKNNTIHTEIKDDFSNKREFINIDFKHNIKLNSFLENGLKRIGKKNYYLLNFPHKNCQYWCLTLLKANHINTRKYKDFIFQKINKKHIKNANVINTIVRFVSQLNIQNMNRFMLFSLIFLTLLFVIAYILFKKIFYILFF